MSVTGETTAVTIFRDRDPTGVQRPYRALVITDGVEKGYGRAQVARTPIGREFLRGPTIQHWLGVLQLVSAIPGSYGRKDGGAGIRGAVSIAAESVKASAGQQIFLLDGCADLCCPGLCLLRDVGMPRRPRQGSHRGARLLIESRQVDFLVRHARRPGFYPSGTFGVFVDSVAVGVMGGLKRPGLLDRFPVRLDKLRVSTDVEVIFAGHQEQCVGIGGSVGVGQTLPIHQVGRLRPLVDHFAFRALPLDQEIELVLRQLEVAIAVHGVERPQSIAAKIPAEAWSRRIS